MNLRSVLRWLILTSALFAGLALLFHDVSVQRQYDTQLINYALDFLRAMKTGTFVDFLTTSRKYPLLMPLLLSIPYAAVLGTMFLTGRIQSDADAYAYLFDHSVALNITGRLFVFLLAIGSLVLVHRAARKIFPKSNPMHAALLLASSIMFVTFSSAVRMHVPAVFMSMLALNCALPLFDRKSFRNECIAFLASAAAFASLQSGVFSLIFPVAAFLSNGDRLEYKKLLHPRLWLWLAVWVILSLCIGYPFLVSSLLSTSHVGFGFGNEDFDSQPFGLVSFLNWNYFIRGTEVFILYFACRYVLQVTLHRSVFPLRARMLLGYALVLTIFFSCIHGTASRMYLPAIAALCILAAQALEVATIGEWLLFAFIVIAAQLRFASFAMLPDTWQQTHHFLQTQTRGVIATDLPAYFLDIPPTRASIRGSTIPQYAWMASLREDLPGARPFVAASDWKKADTYVAFQQVAVPAFGKDWRACAHFVSGPTTEHMFLWVEMKNALWLLLHGRSLGPSIVVHCRERR